MHFGAIWACIGSKIIKDMHRSCTGHAQDAVGVAEDAPIARHYLGASWAAWRLIFVIQPERPGRTEAV